MAAYNLVRWVKVLGGLRPIGKLRESGGQIKPAPWSIRSSRSISAAFDYSVDPFPEFLEVVSGKRIAIALWQLFLQPRTVAPQIKRCAHDLLSC